MNDKNILVTGGAGFIGSHLVDRLIKENPKKLCVIDNLFLGKSRNLEDAKKNFDLKIYKKDATNFKVLKKIIKNNKIDVVFDLAAIPLPTSFERPRFCFENNLDIAFNLIELMRDGLLKDLVHYSTSESYGSLQYMPMDEKHPLLPRNVYGASKAAIDHLLMSYAMVFDIKMSIIRPFNNFGPRQNEDAYAGVIPITIRRILEGKNPILYGDGKQTRDYIFVKDTAEATVRVAKEEKTRGKVINVARGKEIKIGYLIDKIVELMDFKGDIIKELERKSDVRRHFASNKLLKELTGYTPNTSFEDGLKETIEWYKKILR